MHCCNPLTLSWTRLSAQGQNNKTPHALRQLCWLSAQCLSPTVLPFGWQEPPLLGPASPSPPYCPDFTVLWGPSSPAWQCLRASSNYQKPKAKGHFHLEDCPVICQLWGVTKYHPQDSVPSAVLTELSDDENQKGNFKKLFEMTTLILADICEHLLPSQHSAKGLPSLLRAHSHRSLCGGHCYYPVQTKEETDLKWWRLLPRVTPSKARLTQRLCVYEPTLANPSTVTNGQLQVIFMYSEHVSEGICHEEHRTSAWLEHESSALTLIIQDSLLGKNFF